MNNNDYYHKLSTMLENQVSLWQASVVDSDGSSPAKSGMKLAVPLQEAPFGNLGGGELEHKVIDFIRETKPDGAKLYSFSLSPDGAAADFNISMICGGKVSVYIEALHLAQRLYIIGAGHCGKALGQLAKLCGFYVCLIDNRQEILSEDLSDSSHETVLHDYSNLPEVIAFGTGTYVVIMTHGHLHDKAVLEQCLRQETAYLGMIGSKTKIAQTYAKLQEKGFTEAELSRCHAPIGIPIGSQTPYEVAVSIMAELIKQRSGRSAF
ncbi:XdhC/CoxI family protein [Candidatus Cloacimonadota bacterium]